MRGDPNNPEEALGVLNPATARAPDGKLLIFPRVVAAGNYSRIGLGEVVVNDVGNPVSVQRMGYALEPRESWEINAHTAGCENPRITFVEPLGVYIMTYTAYGPLGPRIALAQSIDCIDWERIGPAKFTFDMKRAADFDLYDNKDAFLFPRLVNDPRGKPALAMIHRPANQQGGMPVVPAGSLDPRPGIWISYCDIEVALRDRSALLYWRDHWPLASSQYEWESLKIGGGTAPVLTERGWLTVYHGVSGKIVDNMDHQPYVNYKAGVLILDVNDPRKVLYRSPEPILQPEAAEERTGVVPNVVFPTGLDLRPDGTADVYYGMGDAAIGVARMKVAGDQ